MQSLPDHVQVTVFAKDCWNKKPVISCANPAVASVIALKSFVAKLCNIRRLPTIRIWTICKRLGSVFYIGCRHQATFNDRLLYFTDEYTIHLYLITLFHVSHKKLMLGRNRVCKRVLSAIKFNFFSFLKIF